MQPSVIKNSDLSGATLAFDLDGTLVDTAPDLIRTLNHVLDEAGVQAAPEDSMRPLISFGARAMLIEALALTGERWSEQRLDVLFEKFLQHYGNNVAVDSAPYPSVVEVLEAALRAGANLGVCTNKREDLTRELLRKLGLHDHFKAILGRDTLDVYKPDPRHLTETITRSGGRLERAVMVGDSATDVATAKAAGIPVIAVSFGYSEIPARELGADIVIDHYCEFMPHLPGLLKR